MEIFSYEVPLGSIGNIKTGDIIEQGIIREIHFVGLDVDTMIVRGICESINKEALG